VVATIPEIIFGMLLFVGVCMISWFSNDETKN
jgi:hypothetical protein